jgi:mannose-6-phosphate isomerase-like protein (cupin superfamily)
LRKRRETMTVTNDDTKLEPTAKVFDMREAPVLSEGRLDLEVCGNDGFTARIKVYKEGGENATHTHLTEDHLFLVLGGEATFHIGRSGDEVAVVQPYQGVFVPKGAFYRFASSGTENLVMLRVGHQVGAGDGRVGADDRPLPGNSKENGHVDGVTIPGAFFRTAGRG